MSWLAITGNALGGVGLFLLGMWLLTDGLKLAAGQALERILRDWTRTRPRALVAGGLVTALVQSSSAVTVATIGFVNAGLLAFTQALWVLFGANVGTTMTGWLVALIGFNLNIESFALPMLGIGMALRLTGAETRRGAYGTAIAGFGVLFLGIEVLKTGFIGFSDDVDLLNLNHGGFLAVVVYALAGIALTTLMQSSSAALAVTLTAVAGGLVSIENGAAVAIGANIGTTATALIAVIGATANARRAAAAHVIFNVITGVAALIFLPVILAIADTIVTGVGLVAAPATTLALFHTLFNVLGVALMWPISRQLAKFLENRFRTADEDEARLHHLDDNVIAIPALALDALALELKRLGRVSLRMARAAVVGDAHQGAVTRDKAIVDRVAILIGEFVSRFYRARMLPENAVSLPELLRLVRYYDAVSDLAVQIAAWRRVMPMIGDVSVRTLMRRFGETTDDALIHLDAESLALSPEAMERAYDAYQTYYQEVKAELLRAGTENRLAIADMERLLQQASATRRMIEQMAKAKRRFNALDPVLHQMVRPAAGAH